MCFKIDNEMIKFFAMQIYPEISEYIENHKEEYQKFLEQEEENRMD